MKYNILNRNADSHKGQNGLVLVIGGSKDYVGAPALAGIAALRAGCDMVKIIAPEKVAWAINALSPDLITIKLKGDYISTLHVKKLVTLSKGFDSVLLGSGMAVKNRRLVNRVIKGIVSEHIPIVVDADAVKIADMDVLKDCIITPHRTEFELFLKTNNVKLPGVSLLDKKISANMLFRIIRDNLVGFFDHGNVLLLKGRYDLIISKNKQVVSKGGNAGMTVGGTGDVLAGLCAGYLAQTGDAFNSAVLASKDCKRIGESLMKKSNFGFGFIASDMLREIRKYGAVKL